MTRYPLKRKCSLNGNMNGIFVKNALRETGTKLKPEETDLVWIQGGSNKPMSLLKNSPPFGLDGTEWDYTRLKVLSKKPGCADICGKPEASADGVHTNPRSEGLPCWTASLDVRSIGEIQTETRERPAWHQEWPVTIKLCVRQYFVRMVTYFLQWFLRIILM